MLTEEQRAQLAPYVTNLDRSVFALRNLPEEVIAVLFAYYSRSKDSLRENLSRLIADRTLDVMPQTIDDAKPLSQAQEKARAFHEKWVIGYGHASVAEHAVLHLALEDVSILASKVIEDVRLASFTEKSTRYVQFDKNHYLKPRAIMSSRHASLYEKTADKLFEAYSSQAEPLKARLKELYPPQPDQRPRAYRAALHAKACDILRYMLPAATLTNIGLTINSRALAHMISRLLSEPIEELRELGSAMKSEAEILVPTLLKYAAANPYRILTRDALEAISESHFQETETRSSAAVELVRYDEDAEDRLLAAIIYPNANLPLSQLIENIGKFSNERRGRILDDALKQRGTRDNPLRALEHTSYTFDMLVDFGAYRDIQRHRMASQSCQKLGISHGYAFPEELEELGLEAPFEELMEQAAHCYTELLGSFPHEASYIVPLAFRRRVVFTWNLREAIHFIELRSSPQGHRSYRRVAQEIFREIARVHPFIARFIRVTLEDAELERLESEERLDARREALAHRSP